MLNAQELLGAKLGHKRDTDKLREQLEESRGDVSRVAMQFRCHRRDRETRLQEMAATIRVLSGRGDAFAQAVAARQELETEKLTANNLREDLEAYRWRILFITTTIQRFLDIFRYLHDRLYT
jgi:hypothetical protein